MGVTLTANNSEIEQILMSYNSHDDGDISTERLLQMVADDCGCDISDVVNALAESEERSKDCEEIETER